MKRTEPISKIAILVAVMGVVAFFYQAGGFLHEAVFGGDENARWFARHKVFLAVIDLALIGVLALVVQYLADLKWKLKNKGVDSNA